jgi:uncharacterized C2H2 Zn-finger protein/cell division protein FtsB
MVVLYVCSKCGKQFNRKTEHTRHINKKYSCKLEVNDLNLPVINVDKIKKNTVDKQEILQKPNDDILNGDILNDDVLNMNQQIIQNINDDVLINILNTLKILSKDIEILKEKNDELKESNDELKEKVKEGNKELKESTKDLKESNNKLKKSNDKLNKKIKSLEEKVLDIKPTNIKLINNNITINITAFGKEDLNFIDDETCKKKIFFTGYESIKNYVKLVHFNEDKPEYQNIYISSKKNKNEIMVNDGKKWNIVQTNDIIDKLFFKSMTFIKDKLYIMKDKLPENKIKGVNRLVNDYDEDENKVVKELSKDIVLEIYNNRDKPISNSVAK